MLVACHAIWVKNIKQFKRSVGKFGESQRRLGPQESSVLTASLNSPADCLPACS